MPESVFGQMVTFSEGCGQPLLSLFWGGGYQPHHVLTYGGVQQLRSGYIDADFPISR